MDLDRLVVVLVVPVRPVEVPVYKVPAISGLRGITPTRDILRGARHRMVMLGMGTLAERMRR